MPQYNKAQIKKIIEVLEQQMATASGKAFDKMERARRDLKSWDGTGALPHEKVLRDFNILEALDSNFAETSHSVEKPVMGEENKQPVAQAIQESDPRVLGARKIVQKLVNLQAKESNKEKINALRTIAKSLDDWAKNGAKGEIPHLRELQELGLLPKAISEKTETPVAKSNSKPEVATVATLVDDADRLVKEGRFYDAIQVLKKENTEDAEKRLTRLQTELNRRTKQLAETARATAREQESDFEGRKQAWRAVRDLNPEYQEAHEALQQIERDEIRFSSLYKAERYLKEAEEGDRSDNLPMLNDALVGSQALLALVTNNPSLTDLVDEVQRTTKSIENLRRQTHNRLGVMATAEGQEKFREAYETAWELIERSSPPPTIIKEDGTEQDLHTYWEHIRNEFVSWLRRKALDFVQDAQNVAKSHPELALDKLTFALNILNDSALAREDGISLEPDKKLVQDEIAKIALGIKEYKDAGDLVRKAQGYSRPSERKDLLLKAQQIFPSYPDLKILLEGADVEYANELARIGMDAAVEANHLAGQDKFDEALKKIADASSQITAAFPAPKKDTPLDQALFSLDTEKKSILHKKNVSIDIEKRLINLDQYIKEYDEKKTDGLLKAARTLLEALQKKYPGHHLLEKPNAELVARQGDPDNWNSGKNAYEYQDWIGADGAFKEISTGSPNYVEVQKTDTASAQSAEIGSLNNEKALLILDIDECLIHSSDDPLDPKAHFEAAGYNVIKRPFLDEFLENTAQLYDLAIWTGATEEYVNYICPKIIPEMAQLKFVWSRSHCTLKFDYERNENYWLKDIKKVERFGYTQEHILFVENDPRSLDRDYGNMIRIIPFSGERHDEELRLLLRFLRKISKAENMRKVEKRNWRDTVL